ncbi:DUF2141 domain-containing protein [Penaeicola halotolerans]|uniref:DUF2141 domain-containing protein n=1 Tax=Penaeicola halotolerans TaxID=2793196 RepID=UPI001CF8F1A5|nr:DUF2141 domain-containing protein [Penaeicola halotolerans]
MKFLVLILAILTSIIYQQASSTLTLKFDALRSAKGQILILVFDKKDGYPDDPSKALISKQVNVTSHKTASLSLEDLPHGDYVFAVVHDENNNGKLDTNMVGIPKEGYGFSNDVKGTFGPPDFEKAKYKHTKTASLRIKMNY